MQIGPIVALIILDVTAIRSHALLASSSRKLTDALLLISGCRVAKLAVRARQGASARLAERGEILHRAERRDHRPRVVEAPTVVHRTKAFAGGIFL